MTETALIVGAGSGLSAALARLFVKEGVRVALAARDAQKLAPLVAGTGAKAYRCDASKGEDVEALFASVGKEVGPPDIVVYNPSARARGPIAELDPKDVLN